MVHPYRRMFFYLIFIQLALLIFAVSSSLALNRNVQVISTPASGVGPLEVELRCVVAGNTDSPVSYNMDFGDGSDSELVESTAYSHTFTHTYQSGFYKPVCTVRKSIGATAPSDPGRIIVARWQFETAGDIDTSPAIGVDGTVYVGSDDGNLYAIDPETGTEIWRFLAGSEILSSPTVAPDGTIYFGSQNSLYAVKPNGTLNWPFNVGDYIFSTPAVSADGRTIYIGSSNGSLYAIGATGTMKWQFPFQTGDKITSSPAIGHDGVESVVYVGSQDHHVYAIAADNGALKWQFETKAEVYGSPAIGADGSVYVGECETGSATTYDFDFFRINVDGSKRWGFNGGSGFYSSPAIGPDGIIYVGLWDGYLLALNSGGTISWSVQTSPPRDINSSPAVGANEVIYVGSRDGNFYAFQSPAITDGDNENEKQDWVFQTGDIIRSSPVIDADGTIYFGSRDNNLYAINPGNLTPADSPWPMFHKNAAHTGAADSIEIPAVISSIPERNNIDVDVQTAPIKVNFSPVVEASQVDIDSFILEKKTGSGREAVDGFAVLDFERYNNSGYHVVAVFNRLNKSEPLAYNTTYNGTIWYSEEAVTDQSGADPYDQTYSWSFTTESAPVKEDGSGDGGDPACFISAISD
ncbi:MAG: PQQ-binding-like beta-propeller repeat protein [Desulfobacteraceae bacterium]|nr:PQQ-binding-like beta-propeller repeat protein [Desulfobacteraceae bacterium]